MAGGCCAAGCLAPGVGKGIVFFSPDGLVMVMEGVPVGAGGVAGPGFTGAAFWCSKTLPDETAWRVARMARLRDVTINTAAARVVALERTVADPRGPKAVCEPMPPKAPARSAALPLCSNTTMMMKKQTRM